VVIVDALDGINEAEELIARISPFASFLKLKNL
jgi:hypothetical protein